MCLRDAIPYGLFMLIYEYTAEKLSNGYETNGKHIRNADIDPVYTAAAGAIAGMVKSFPSCKVEQIYLFFLVQKTGLVVAGHTL